MSAKCAAASLMAMMESVHMGLPKVLELKAVPPRGIYLTSMVIEDGSLAHVVPNAMVSIMQKGLQ